MKIKKKTALLASFAVGALLFATTALADIASKSGYEQLKDALKTTAATCSDKFDNFTLDITMAVKDNGKTVSSESKVEKYDRKKKATETASESEMINVGKNSYYTYSDQTTFIRQFTGDENYYVTEIAGDVNQSGFTNPFNEPQAVDIERIADAVVGNLKDNVVVKENADGSKELSGSLSEVQIPPLVNAVSSFFLKQQFNGREVPRLTQDIFVKQITGKAVINKDGIMESLLATAAVSGKDASGQEHDFTFEFLGKLSGINQTSVVKPDLTGKKVVKETANKGQSMADPQRFVGKFKNDIITTKDGKFVKVGERILEITAIDSQIVSGKYYETYKPGFEQYAANKLEFSFNGKFANDQRQVIFDQINKNGFNIQGLGFDDMQGKVYLNGGYPNNNGLTFDPVFNPDLD